MQFENFLRHLCVAELIELWKTTEQVEGLHIPLNVFTEFRTKVLPDKMSIPKLSGKNQTNINKHFKSPISLLIRDDL